MFDTSRRTDFSIAALQQLFKEIKDKYLFTDIQLRAFGQWLRDKSGMNEAENRMRFDSSPLFLSTMPNNDSYETALIFAFKLCDTIIDIIPSNVEYEQFMELAESLVENK